MSDLNLHPPTERLEDFAADLLAAGERAVVASHLNDCARCRAELEEVRTLFSALAALPRFEPAAGFAERVMARVEVPVPWAARAAEWIKGVLPGGTLGLGLATAFFALPLLVIAGLLAWLVAMPGVTVGGLLAYGQLRIGQLVLALMERSVAMLVESELLRAAAAAVQGLATAGSPAQMAGAAAAAGLLSVVSAWIVYRYVIRTPSREMPYAS